MPDVPSPVLAAYMTERLRTASIFMFIHSAVPVVATVAEMRPEEIPACLANLSEDTKRVWHKFTSDLSVTVFHRFCDHTWQCRNIDAFQMYLTRMLFEVFTQRPETLRSSESIRASDVLDCEDMNEVVRRLAERKVSALAYRGFDELQNYLHGQLGLPGILGDPATVAVREGMEVRNIIVHNRGVVNRLFLRRTKRTDLAEGSLFPLDQDYVIKNGHATLEVVKKLDASFVEHFRLRFGVAEVGGEGSDK